MDKKLLLTIALLTSISLFGWGCAKPSDTQAPATQEPAAAETGESNPAELQPTSITETTSTAGTATKPETTVKTHAVVVPPKTDTTKQPADKPTTHTVSITASAFSPQVIAGNAGDTIRWVNNDTKPHTTASDGSLLWDSGSLQPGAAYSRVFKAAGSYPYHDGSTGIKGTVVIH